MIVGDCEVTRVATISTVDLTATACNTFNDSNGDEEILLCFGTNFQDQCYR